MVQSMGTKKGILLISVVNESNFLAFLVLQKNKNLRTVIGYELITAAWKQSIVMDSLCAVCLTTL